MNFVNILAYYDRSSQENLSHETEENGISNESPLKTLRWKHCECIFGIISFLCKFINYLNADLCELFPCLWKRTI